MTKTPASPLEAARALAPLIRQNADAIEAARELPRPLFEALADAGMFLLAVPRALGGTEVDFPLYVDGDAVTARRQGIDEERAPDFHAADQRRIRFRPEEDVHEDA